MGSTSREGRVVSRLRPATRPALARALAAACTGAAVLALAGCASDDPSAGAAGTTPAATTPTGTAVATPSAPARSGPLTQSEQIAATPDSPKAFATALKQHRAIVVTFVLAGIADDDYVADAVAAVRRNGLGGGVAFLTWNVQRQKNFGNLPTLLNVTGTPSVTVIGRDGRLVNQWGGLVDEKMLRQAVADAKDATP
ncbi:MAG: hypothetical protein IT200_15550 [Thermoleophilia bacterium]|nr:hypothetical protein [Thermoleophilia bacterium]